MRWLSFFVLVAGLLAAGCQGESKPQGGSQATGPAGLTDPQVKDNMRTYIQDRDRTLAIEGRTVRFDHIHEKVKTRNGDRFACADFVAGTDTFDIDLYVDPGSKEVVKTVFHKRNDQTIGRTLWTRN